MGMTVIDLDQCGAIDLVGERARTIDRLRYRPVGSVLAIDGIVRPDAHYGP